MRALAEARALGFLGPGPVEDHVAHAEAFLSLWPAGREEGAAIDVGSGGGVPGLVLASRLPRWRWVLLDVNRRRTSFLARTVASLPGLRGRVQVIRATTFELARDPAHRTAYDVATARSFGPPLETAEQAGAFVRVGGLLLASDAPEGAGRWEPAVISPLGLVLQGRREEPPGVVALRRVEDLAADRPWRQRRFT